ncbi:regulator of G-protein signaling 22 [Boleophthalmus pectinirostris]|uniref:regulator of G-protein signaling 22 n=1 Tax=Boleophthalmus pectinirostris TaxID=150288 RepID=UPI00242D013B|nr:regulator of G-protein signaling 22 [Boleophthalmus pectinirostris]
MRHLSLSKCVLRAYLDVPDKKLYESFLYPELCVVSSLQENTLSSDTVFVCFFNDFLCLPCFPESLRFNQDTGLFEVDSGQAQSVYQNIRLGLLQLLSTSDPNELAHTPLIDNGYTVCCLDPKQGSEWVMRERLPFFLKSDFYFEYRFADLLLQWEPKCGVQRRAIRSAQSERTNGHAKSSDKIRRSASCFELDHPHPISPLSQEPSYNLTEPLAISCEESRSNDSTKFELECLAATLVKQVLNAAIRMMSGHNQANTSTCCNKSEKQQIDDCIAIDCSTESKVQLRSPAKDHGPQERDDHSRKDFNEMGARQDQWNNGQDVGSRGNCGKRWSLFKEFLKGTPGEGLLHLWMDIERMKVTEVLERKKRFLDLMRSRYLMSSSQTCLNAELLSRLGLSTSTCWTQEKLQTVQPQITHSLLFYWAARFWTSHRAYEDPEETPNATIWTYFSSTSTIQTSLYRHETDALYSPNPHLPPSPRTDYEFCPSRGPLLATGQMERMIQALCVENGAGLYFTHFCEQSGNQLWVNAVYFWSDLQNYHELFYQDGLDPYRVQREAQLLYATFLCSSAWRSLGIHEDMRRKVYERLMPAFEELFDDIEEHVLSILLEPWTILINRDEESYQQVPVQEETRRVDTQEYRELQSLYEESGSRLKQMQSDSVLSAPEFSSTLRIPQMSESWSKVSSDYKGYRLGSLLRHRHEIGYFMNFLQNQNASIHLSCWLDLEQYRRTHQTDTALRLERSAHLVNRYLNRKYFFGPDSPASIDQQHEILRLTGGFERLKLDCLSDAVVMEIQDIVRSHLEGTWLPDFLSTAEFVQRQKDKPKPHATSRFSDNRKGRHQRKARREIRQCEGLWMSSSKEILSFRKVLLDPASCLQFQHFVSLKGDFLENDVLFWLEVQRYKDLCHSHSDEATIEKKISTIISVFINSSVPPALQIDIPPDQAQTLLENRHKLGPYIFREAQMSVFSELLRFWPEFQDLRSSFREEQLLQLLEQKRLKHRAKVRRQRRREEEEEEEERRAQEEQQKQESSFRDEDEEDDDEEDFSDEERSVHRLSKTQSRLQFTPAKVLTWSYSKYMAALKREEILLRRKNQLDTSFSTISDFSSCSVRSAGTVHTQKQLSLRSRTSTQQRHSYSKGVKPFNIK